MKFESIFLKSQSIRHYQTLLPATKDVLPSASNISSLIKTMSAIAAAAKKIFEMQIYANIYRISLRLFTTYTELKTHIILNTVNRMAELFRNTHDNKNNV